MLKLHWWPDPPCCVIAQALAQFAPQVIIFRVNFWAGEGIHAPNELHY